MSDYTQKQLGTLEQQKKEWMSKTAPIRDMLNSSIGRMLMDQLKAEAFKPAGGIYVQGSFDKTAFNLGVLSVYNKLLAIQEGIE